MAFRRGPRLILRARILIRSAWAFLGFRSAWDWLELLRQLTLMVMSGVIVGGLLAVNEKVPWIARTAELLLVVAVVRKPTCPRRGSHPAPGAREPQGGRVRYSGLAG